MNSNTRLKKVWILIYSYQVEAGWCFAFPVAHYSAHIKTI